MKNTNTVCRNERPKRKQNLNMRWSIIIMLVENSRGEKGAYARINGYQGMDILPIDTAIKHLCIMLNEYRGGRWKKTNRAKKKFTDNTDPFSTNDVTVIYRQDGIDLNQTLVPPLAMSKLNYYANKYNAAVLTVAPRARRSGPAL